MKPDFWRGKRVFVTGHTGFKGSWLSLWLSELGAEVSGYSLEPPTSPSLFASSRIEGRLAGHTIADVRDLDALTAAMRAARPDIAIHMAAQPLVRHSYAAPVETYAVNVMGTVHFLEAARTVDTVQALLCVTTDKCYENVHITRGYREDDPLGGHDPYSSSKAGSELVASAYRRSFFGQGPRLATGRAGNVIGGGDWANDRLVVDLVKSFLRGEKTLIRAPKAVRPWQHVLEPLSGYLTLCEALWHEQAGAASAFNFGPAPEDAKPVEWIADRLSHLWGGGAGWTLDNSTSHPHEAHYLYLDTAKAEGELGYRPRWKLDDALANIVQWYKAFAAGDDPATLTLAQIAAFQTAQKQTA